MASPVSIGCPLSPAIEDQRTKTFSKNAFKPSLHGATAFDVQELAVNSDENDTQEDIDAQSSSTSHESSVERDVEDDASPGPEMTMECGTPPTDNGNKAHEEASKSSTNNKSGQKRTPNKVDENYLDAFEFVFENVPAVEDTFADNDMISSPMPQLFEDGDLDESKLRDAIKFLIELDAENMNLSTKHWMQEIATHFGVASLPKQWKGTIRDLLVEEATAYTYTQTETETAHGDDCEDLEDSVGGLTPVKSKTNEGTSELFRDREEADSDDEDDDSAAPPPTPGSPPTPKAVKKAEPEKNEELQVLEKLQAEMSERDKKMAEYLQRDEDELDSKADERRKKLQELNKKRTLEKIAAAAARNTSTANDRKALMRELRAGRLLSDHEVQILKGAKISLDDSSDSSEDDDDDDENQEEAEEEGCIVLSDDDEDADEDDVAEDDREPFQPTITINKGATFPPSVSPRYNPFLRVKNVITKEPTNPAKKWSDEKQKFRQRARENALAFQAKEVGCETVEMFSKMLDIVELNKMRDVAQKRIDKQKLEEKMAIEKAARQARELEFKEAMFLAQDDDSEGELDEEAELSKAITLAAVMKHAEVGAYDVDVDTQSSDEEEDGEEDDEEGEEERLAAALRKEEEILEKLRRQEEEEEEKLKAAASIDKKPMGDEDDLVDSDGEGDDEGEGTSESVREARKKKKEKKAAKKSMTYLEMVKLEEQQARESSSKRGGASFLDDEAEEEEDDAAQTGLGDYGFKFAKSDVDEEREALKYRKGELSHIVADEEVDSGDEEGGRNRRMQAEEKDDKEQLTKIVTGLAEGYKSRHNRGIGRMPSGMYGQDDLAQEGIYTSEKVPEKSLLDDPTMGYDDDEQAWAAGIGQMTSRVRQQGQVEEVEELTDDSEDEDEDDTAADGSEMTEDERLLRAEQRRLQSKQERQDYRRFYAQALRNRALRQEKLKGRSVSVSNDPTSTSLPLLNLVHRLPPSSGLIRSDSISNHSNSNSGHAISRVNTMPTHMPSSKPASGQLVDVKRRTIQPPKKVEGGNVRPRAPKRSRSDGSAVGEGNKTNSSLMSGVLDKNQLDAGYGMGMCVSNARRKVKEQAILDSNSRSDSNMAPSSAPQTVNCVTSSLFSAVTGRKTDQPTRSFSGVLERSKSMTQGGGVGARGQMGGGTGLVTVTSHQYVFMEGSQMSHLHDSGDGDQSCSGWGGEASRHGDDTRSRQGAAKKRTQSGEEQSGALKRPKSVGAAGGGSMQQSALFSKISSGTGPVRASTTAASTSSTKRFRPSAAMRSKLESFSHTSIVMK